LNPPIFAKDPLEELYPRPAQIDPGLPASMNSATVGALVATYVRYESSIENKLYRAMNQLERLQRAQQGEQLSAPVAVDVGVHVDQSNSDVNATPLQLVREDRPESDGDPEIPN
jgi:hypothetical protein